MPHPTILTQCPPTCLDPFVVLSETIVAPAKHKEENGTNSQHVENLDKRQRLQSMLQVAARSGRKDETRGRTDTEGFVIKETVEVFVETEAGRDRAVGHDLRLVSSTSGWGGLGLGSPGFGLGCGAASGARPEPTEPTVSA